MCESDSDVVRWGLDFLDVDKIFNPNFYGNTNGDVGISHEQYVKDGHHHDSEINCVENDEILAHALQEEFSQISVGEEARSTNAMEDHMQSSTDTHDWRYPSETNYYYGDEGGLREADNRDPSSSCSSPGDRSYDGDDYSYTLEITEDSDVDGELGKRLNHMIHVPHVPRINGDIPSIDEATSDHQRLLDRLELYNLVESKVRGDGNCQFRALSDQFYRTPEHHKFVRRQVVNQLKSHPDLYEGYVPMEYSDYLKNMSKNGEWGDHVTLQAAADSYGIKIFVLTSFKGTCSIEILPKTEKSNRVIFLSFWAEVHYNSIYPQGELPLSDSKRKKRWWIFGNKN